MTDVWDDDDRAIARALGADPPDTEGLGADAAGVDAAAVADYEAVLAELPFDEVAPPADLEDRVVAAALARRPPAARSIDSGRTARDNRGRDARRQASRRWIAAGVTTIAAAVIVVALAVARPSSGPGSPGARIEPASATESVGRVLAQPGTRRGVLRTSTGATAGRVALASNGQGYLYGLASTGSTGAQWLWLDTASGPVRAGRITGAPTTNPVTVHFPTFVHFVVHGDVAAVTGAFVTNEASSGPPNTPGTVESRAVLTAS